MKNNSKTNNNQVLYYNNIEYKLQVDWDSKQVLINGINSSKTEYDSRSKAIYAAVPDENVSLMVIAQKNKFYIFEYDPNDSLLNNGGKHFFVKLNSIHKFLVAVSMILPISILTVLFRKGPDYYLYGLGLSLFYFFTTITYCAVLKTPLVKQNRKSLLFVISSIVISAITSIIGLYLLYGLTL